MEHGPRAQGRRERCWDRGAVARDSLGVLAGARGPERRGERGGPRPEPNARAAPRDSSCTEKVSEAGALGPRSCRFVPLARGWRARERTASGGAGRGGSADSCPIRVPLEPSAGCSADDQEQGEQCLQLQRPERRAP